MEKSDPFDTVQRFLLLESKVLLLRMLGQIFSNKSLSGEICSDYRTLLFGNSVVVEDSFTNIIFVIIH